MDASLPLALTGMVIGIAYAAVPGAVNTESMRQTLRHGLLAGWQVQVGSLAGDLLWAMIGLTSAAMLLQRDSLAIALGLVGAGFMLNLARGAITTALRPVPDQVTTASGDRNRNRNRNRNSLRIGVTFGLANPAGIFFWSGLGAGALGGSGDPAGWAMLVLLACFCGGALLWGTLLVGLVGYGRRFASHRVLRWVDGICGLVLGWFGMRLLWQSLQRARTWLFPAMRAIF